MWAADSLISRALAFTSILQSRDSINLTDEGTRGISRPPSFQWYFSASYGAVTVQGHVWHTVEV